jgi:hypothetical protein
VPHDSIQNCTIKAIAKAGRDLQASKMDNMTQRQLSPMLIKLAALLVPSLTPDQITLVGDFAQ